MTIADVLKDMKEAGVTPDINRTGWDWQIPPEEFCEKYVADKNKLWEAVESEP